MGLFSCSDMISALVILLFCQIQDGVSGSYCYNRNSIFKEYNYCAYGCCVDEYDGCCTNHSGAITVVIIGSLVSLAALIGFIVCLCCVCKRQQRNRGQVLNPQQNVVLSQNTVQTNNTQYGYAYPMQQGYAYPMQANYPQAPPPYTPSAYPSPQPQPQPQPQPPPQKQSQPSPNEHEYTTLKSSAPQMPDTGYDNQGFSN